MTCTQDDVIPGLRPPQVLARQRIESQVNLPRLFAAFDTVPSIAGAGVILREAERCIAPQQFAGQLNPLAVERYEAFSE